MRMIKRAAKIAAGIAVGVAIGGGVLPGIIFRDLYSDAWPPVWKQGLLYFVTGFIAAFSVLLLIYRIKEQVNKNKRACKTINGRVAMAGLVAGRAIFESELPENVDWQQVNAFLRTTKFYKQLLCDDWRKSDAFTVYPVSDASMNLLACLHEDLLHCYKGVFAVDENGEEDRHAEYRLLRENLYAKYERIDADILEGIYLYYLQEDR